MEFILGFILTFGLGPLVFWLLTRTKSTEKRFPATMTGALGDTLFLPVFNGFFAYHYSLVKFTFFEIPSFSFVLIVIFCIWYIWHKKYQSHKPSWMYTSSGSFSIAGWYHVLFVIIQSSIIVITLTFFYDTLGIYVALFGYVFTTGMVRSLLAKFGITK